MTGLKRRDNSKIYFDSPGRGEWRIARHTIVSDYSDEVNTWELKIDTDGYRLHSLQYSRILLDHLIFCLCGRSRIYFSKKWMKNCMYGTITALILSGSLTGYTPVCLSCCHGDHLYKRIRQRKSLYLPSTRNCSMTSSPHLERRTKLLQ
ncbi:hypothetical protein BO83DRAFT_60860 [Aspergillus eucalypticola CBS 122712]|uniref:Uncharacterized protein n=1 Tax=Aspergillus eucalypticola (strain CBS 122712 / IBT 29274) TaxID=1448314 RepID=A0A317VDE8_ASPEC|nr:uncharacterized protein BO83DRAFT_60860 [Aspergillus eucalypticola CBS 122712]PWY69910.1 hypothetical protein BO83DRAFT_60860 [Aspergillus eucalypticola CBS 122712]